MAVTAPAITPLPDPPLPTDAPAVFDTKAGASLLAQQAMVPQINASLNWIAAQVNAAEGYKNAAATSATNAADSASAANAAKLAAQQAVTAAEQAGATQVALAANQVALANTARSEAQAAAQAAGAAVGLPGGRVPFTALQIDADGNVSWAYGVPDRAPALAGHSITLNSSKIPVWGRSGMIGDVLLTPAVIATGSEYVLPDSLYLKSSFPELAALLGSIPRGIQTTGRTTPSGVTPTAVCYGNGLYVLADSGGRIYSSPDAVTWTQRATVTSALIRITRANGIFVGVGNQVCYTSVDGITWISRSLPVAQTWRGVTFGNGVFVAVGGAPSQNCITSPDGVNWTTRTMSNNAQWMDVIFDGVQFVAVAANAVCVSPDGVTWTSNPVPSSALTSIAFGNGCYIATSTGSNSYLYSEDLLTWQALLLPQGSTSASLVFFANGIFIVLLPSKTKLAFSVDGVKWVPFTIPQSVAVWAGITFGNDEFLAISTSTFSVRISQYAYDKSTQFATPKIPVFDGMKAYIKAKVTA